MHMISYRQYVPSDREAVYSISKKSNLEGYDIAELDELYEDWPEGQLVACDSETVIGFLSGKIHDASRTRVYMFAVLPDYRSKGIGQHLLDDFYQLTSKLGYPNVILEVRETNIRAQVLYARNGFVKIDEIRGLYVSGELAYRLEKVL